MSSTTILNYLPLSFKFGQIFQKLLWPEFEIPRISACGGAIIEFAEVSADLLHLGILIVLRHTHVHLSVVRVVEHVAVAAGLPYLIASDQTTNSGLNLN